MSTDAVIADEPNRIEEEEGTGATEGMETKEGHAVKMGETRTEDTEYLKR